MGDVKEAIVLVDLIGGFFEPGCPLYCGDEVKSIVPNVVSLLISKPEATRIFVCDSHRVDDPEFKMFPPHCVEGTSESRILPQFERLPGLIIKKRTFDVFYGNELSEIMQELSPDRVYVVGVCTDICVLYAVAGLRVRGYDVIVPKNCVGSFDKDSHEWAMNHFVKVLGARVE
ncbi:MAG: cysteine hydrolase [Candidatus Coatesbacteria bacterium]|nr:cysteine hydrolase [Candidatus Coatesbacteria bacterium]